MKRLLMFLRAEIVIFFLIYIVLVLLKANEIGLLLRDKITLVSTLDFSWQSDSIERLLHGYIQGKDFVFTYGPLFQFLYSLPSLILHVPSYISVLLSPFISLTLSFCMSVVIIKNLTKDVTTRLTLLLFLWFLIGLIAFDSLNTVRILVPLFYITLWTRYIHFSKLLSIQTLFISILPTLFGFFSYDLFLSTFFLSLILTSIYSIYQKKLSYLLHVLFIVLFQLLGSVLLTHNFSYIYTSLDTVKNYYYIMNIGWAKDRSNVLFIFPLILLFLGFNIWKTKGISKKEKVLLLTLAFVSLFEIRTSFARSDAGHIIKALYPSIVMTFIFIFSLAKNHRYVIVVGLFLYLLIPFKPIYYNTLSPKNIMNVISVVKNSPPFFTIYKLPSPFYYNEHEIRTFASLIRANREQVYIYPYDNYILNIFHNTYNSFALQPYQYSSSLVEQETVKRLQLHPPRYILLGIDSKGALDLDDIPNFTRNPLIAQWMLQNYEVKKRTSSFLLLSFNSGKKTIPISNKCTTFFLSLNLKHHKNILSTLFSSLIKANIYYLSQNPLVRLPATSNSHDYLIVENASDPTISDLFNEKMNFSKPFMINPQTLTIYQENQLTKQKKSLLLKRDEFDIQCIN